MTDSLYVATRKGLFRYRRQGASWAALPTGFLGIPVTAVLRDRRDGTLYAALKHGHFGVKLHRSEDAGETWQELPTPAFASEGKAEGDDKNKGAAGPSVEMIWSLVAGGSDEPGRIWVGTLPGAMFRLSDRGERFALVDSLWNMPARKEWMGGGYDSPGIHSIHVDPRDSRRLTIAVSTGGVWKSDDGGAAWRLVGKGLRAEYFPPEKTYDPAVQDVHRLAHCAAAPDTVWCQHHNGIFRSTDGATTFTEITGVKPSVFGFAVGAHPRDPEVAWFVPAVKDEFRVPVDGRLVVNRTTDGGRSFRAFGEGLPGSDCYDLVYRHGLDVSADGSGLALGSTTGGLWTSDDGGERWKLLNAHLPPIAQVAFG